MLKKFKEIWNVIYWILKLSYNLIRFELDFLNKFFVGIVERIFVGNKLLIFFEDLFGVIKNLFLYEDESLIFNFWFVIYYEVF